jgi:hypothetical protein
MADFNLNDFSLKGRLPPKGEKWKPDRRKPKTGGRFVRGPISLAWLGRAAALPGKSLHVGLAVWYLSGLTKSRTVKLASATGRIFGADRYAVRRALMELEKVGLAAVERHPGRAPLVTILDVGHPEPMVVL